MRSAILEQLNSDGKASPAEWSLWWPRTTINGCIGNHTMLHRQQLCSRVLLKVVLSNSRSEGRQPGGGVPTDALFLTRPRSFCCFYRKLSAADLLMPQESSIAGGIAGQKQRDNTPCRGCLFVD